MLNNPVQSLQSNYGTGNFNLIVNSVMYFADLTHGLDSQTELETADIIHLFYAIIELQLLVQLFLTRYIYMQVH